MRILLSKKSKLQLFNYLKKEHHVKSLRRLSNKIGIPFDTLKRWRYTKIYLPDHIIPKENIVLEIIDKKPDNWGQIKGGIANSGVPKKLSFTTLEKKRRIGRIIGKKNLAKIKEKYGDEFIRMIVKGKLQKTRKRSEILTNENETFFRDKIIKFNFPTIFFSNNDIKRKIILPSELTPFLAEEIGAHIGDGTLSKKKYYFSIRSDKREEGYFTKFLFQVYKKLFNINLDLLKRQQICGFELGSRAIYEFKNKVIGLPIGEKKDRIKVPSCIIKSKNKEIFYSFLRGIFDTDGCITFRHGRYPLISIQISSQELINKLGFMLFKLGFLFYKSGYTIRISGPVMVEKWIKEIGSHNPKHINKFKKAGSIIGQYMAPRLKVERP